MKKLITIRWWCVLVLKFWQGITVRWRWSSGNDIRCFCTYFLKIWSVSVVTVYHHTLITCCLCLCQLHEMDVDISQKLVHSDTCCDVVCLLYDVTNPRTFDYCAQLYTVSSLWSRSVNDSNYKYMSITCVALVNWTHPRMARPGWWPLIRLNERCVECLTSRTVPCRGTVNM